MTRYVLDVSAALTWCFDDEPEPLGLPDAAAASDTEMHVPSLWPLELLDALRTADARGRLTPPESWEFLEWVFTLPIVVDEPLRGSGYVALLHLARELSVSVYDATYLELARRLGVPLATRDAALIAAAARTGVSIFGVERGVSSA